MELRARIAVEGLWAGLHRSPYRGFSVEFSEYRQYSPGDDLRYLDWKALARTDREFLKVFEDETNLRCLILLDASRSMSFGSETYSKIEYARTLAATLAYFLIQQRDIVGLARFDRDITDYLQPRWRPGHLRRLLALLERNAEGNATDLARTFQSASRLCRKRCLIVVISDFLSDPAPWRRELGQLTAAGHDIRALQILDPSEISLDFGKPAHWQDLETEETVYIDPKRSKDRYQKRFQDRRAAVSRALHELSVPLQTFTTDQPLDAALLAFISGRSKSVSREQQARKAVS